MIKLADRVAESSTTMGTSAPYALAGAAAPELRTFLDGVGDGVETYYCAVQAPDWEIGIGKVHAGTPATLERVVILASSNSGGAVNWGAGTRSVFGTVAAGSILLVANLLSEIAALGPTAQASALANLGAGATGKLLLAAATAAAARSTLGLGTSSLLDAGTAALKILQLDASAKIPAVDGSQITHLPQPDTLVAPAWTGGSSSKIVRYTSGGAVVAADKSDTCDLLNGLLFARGADGVLYGRGLVPFAGASDGVRYFLGASGALRTTAGVAGDAFNSIVQVGFGAPAIGGVAQLWFDPQPAVGAVLTSGVPVKMESGLLKA